MSYLESPPSVTDSVAEVLVELAREIEELGGSLCGDPQLVSAHMQELQAIDLIAQKLGSLAGLLTARCPRTALEQTQLDGLRDRLAHLGDELPHLVQNEVITDAGSTD